MKRPKLRELKEAITAILTGPYTSKFPAEPARVADVFRGKPEFDEDECVGCGACYNVCPPGAIEMEDDPQAAVRRITIRLDRCIFCGQCAYSCHQGSITFSKEFELAQPDRKNFAQAADAQQVDDEECDLDEDAVP